MASFWKPNLEKRGRLLRAILGSTLVLSGLVVIFFNVWAGVALLGSGGFVLFEAFRGWCVVRACGIKTRI